MWMWSEAFGFIEHAERLHRQFFHLGRLSEPLPAWEPPVDIFETEGELSIVIALPGVAAEQLEILTDGSTVVVRGRRSLPEVCGNAAIRRLEIPYGQFERRIELPSGHFQLGQRTLRDGCLFLVFSKVAP